MPDVDILPVQSGDILAIKEESARLQLIEATPTGYEYYFTVGGTWNERTTNGYTLTFPSNQNSISAAHAVRAHVVRPVRMKFRHTYDGLGSNIKSVTITTSNTVTTQFDTVQLIEVMAQIANLTIDNSTTAGM